MKGKHNLTFISIYIYLIIIILLPKDLSNLFGVIPIRTTLTYILFLIFMLDKYKNKIAVNDISFKWFGIGYGIFLFCTLPSLIMTKSVVMTLYTIVKFLAFILLFYVFIKVKFTKEEYKKIINLIIILTTLKFIWGLMEYIFEIDLFTVGAYKYPGAKGRVTAYFFNTIYYGIYINLVFAYGLYFFNKTENKREKIFLGIVLVLAFINIILTFTRSSFLVFSGIAFLELIILNKKVLTKGTLLIIIVSLAIGLAIPGTNTFVLTSVNDITRLVFKNNFLERFISQDKVQADKDAEMGDYSLSHRVLFAKTAVAIGRDNELTGIGFGSYIDYIETEEFTNKYPQYNNVKTHPHSSFILMFSEIGVFGLAAFMGFIVTIFVKIGALIKNKTNNDIAKVMLIITIGFCITNIIAENAFYDTQIFSLYLLIIGLSINYLTNYKTA